MQRWIDTNTGAPRYAFIILTALVIALCFQGTRGLYETTEGRYSECAREMVVSGNYLEPTLHFQPHWTKPPLAYWSIAAGLKAFGVNTWGARAMLIPAFLLTVLAVGLTASRMWDGAAGRWAALVYATSLMPAITVNVVSTDVFLTCAVSLALLGFWTGLRKGGKLPFVLMWAAFGTAFLTKGFPGLLPLPGVIAAWSAARRSDGKTPSLFHPLGLAVFVLVGLGWYLYEARLHPGLLSYWLGYETLSRMTDTSGEFHNSGLTAALTIYGPVLLFGTLPWCPLALPWKRLFGGKGALRKAIVSCDPRRIFLLGTFAIPLILFCVARSKLPLYLLPLFIPLSLAAGRGLAQAVKEGRRRGGRLLWAALAVMVFVVTLKGLAGYAVENSGDMKRLYERIDRTLQEQGIPPEALAVLSGRKLYGLDFYANRVLPRIAVTDEGKAPAGPAAVTPVVEPGSAAAVLAERGNVRPLESRLGPLPEPQTITLSDRWSLLYFRGLGMEGRE